MLNEHAASKNGHATQGATPVITRVFSDTSAPQNGHAVHGVPAVLEQKTTICCKYLYLLASLKDSPCLGGAYEDKPQRCGRKPCSWVKDHGKRGQNQGFSSPEYVDEDLCFLPHHLPRKYGALFFVRLLREPLVPINGADCRRSALLVHLQTP